MAEGDHRAFVMKIFKLESKLNDAGHVLKFVNFKLQLDPELKGKVQGNHARTSPKQGTTIMVMPGCLIHSPGINSDDELARFVLASLIKKHIQTGVRLCRHRL